MWQPLRRLSLVLIVALCAMAGSYAADDAREIGFGRYLDQHNVTYKLLILDEELNDRITEIGNSIVRVSSRPDLEFKFRVVNDPMINAFATSGGFVYINTGLLGVVESADELAAIIAHEISHIGENHLVRRIDSAHKKRTVSRRIGSVLGVIGGVALAWGGSLMDPFQLIDYARQIGGLGGGIIAEALIRGYDKKQELNADKHAIRSLQKAGYDPYALIRVFQNLQQKTLELDINLETYGSKLINAKPGLEKRIKYAEKSIDGSR